MDKYEADQTPTNKIHDYVTWPAEKTIFEGRCGQNRGGLAFPDQNNSHCRLEAGKWVSDEGTPVGINLTAEISYSDTPIDVSEIHFTPDYALTIMPGYINFKISTFTFDNETCQGCITLTDSIPDVFITRSFLQNTATLRPITFDSLECTSLVSAPIRITNIDGNTVSFESQLIQYPFDWATDVTCELVIELNLSLTDEVYVYASKQPIQSENGVYVYTKSNVRKVADAPVSSSDDDVDEILNHPTVNDNVACCDHFRNDYSARELYDETTRKVGAVTGFGVKSASFSACDGGLVNWFTSNGEVNLGNNHGSVYVTGFGLGGMYNAASTVVQSEKPVPKDAYDENDRTTLHPWMEWAYGTRFDATAPNNVVALPRDWPFTYLPDRYNRPVFNQLTDTNNVTLVKKGDYDGGNTVGNLERYVDNEHIYNNRHHFVLYPDYRAIHGEQNYRDGSVVVKPLFIHIPAPLDTKDGETVDITVSIQNVNQNDFGDANFPEAALSGYYAAMTQPRVYVMGGVQLFSNKKISIDRIHEYGSASEGFHFEVSSIKNVAFKNDGKTLLEEGTLVRANIVSMPANATGERKTFTAHGYVESNSDEGGTTIVFDGLFPYKEYSQYNSSDPVGRRRKFMICGMAYLTYGDNPTNTPMGLVSRDPALHRSDMENHAGDAGEGQYGELDYYNKFYAVNSADAHKVNLPEIDKRYVLATVYQTATSTFPWALANRKKLASISKSWTDEFTRDSDHKSLLRLIYEENQSVYQKAVEAIGHDQLRSLSFESSPMFYLSSAPWTSVASCLRVQFPGYYNNDPITTDEGNPVRVARNAVNTLASDFRLMRLVSYTSGKRPRTKVTSLRIDSIADWPNPADSLNTDISNPDNGATPWQKVLLQCSWCSKLRNLPDYITVGTSDTDYRMVSDSDAARWETYVESAKDLYPNDEMSSSDATETLPYGGETETAVYSETSVMGSLRKQIKKTHDTNWMKLLDDFRRYSETVSAVCVDEAAYMTLGHLGGTAPYTYTTVDDSDPTRTITITTEKPLHEDTEWMNPFTNIQSIDTVPYPTVSASVLAGLADGQKVFASADAVQMYRYEYDDANDAVDTVSSVMPTATDLAKFLESYVVAYSSKMPLHQYQGTRVLLKNGAFPADASDPIYVRTIARMKKRMEASHVDEDVVSHYIKDCFASTSSDTRDPNVDRVNVSGTSIGVSAPPYVQPADFKNQTYTRVYMQFTFSQKAGRWYTTDYRQYPTNYLSPLYGADALNAQLPTIWNTNGTLAVKADEHGQLVNETTRNVWHQCGGIYGTSASNMYSLYSDINPMDITLGCVPYLAGHGCVFDFENQGKLLPAYNYAYDAADKLPLSRLETPYKPITDGGLGLYPPADVNGGYSDNTDAGIHANFWSVRRFVRPSVSVLAGTDVPGHDDPLNPVPTRKGGLVSDATLYRMFDFPKAGTVEYKVPDATVPDADTSVSYLLYHSTEEDADGAILANAFALGYSVGDQSQHIETP